MKKINSLSAITLAVFFVFGLTGTASAATTPNLGAATNFSILAQTLITGISTISGDVGSNNAAGAFISIPALLPANVAGIIYSTDGLAPSAAIIPAAVQADASTVYTVTIPSLPIEGAPIVGAELNGITRGPGVYDLVGASITLSGGVLTLDGAGTYIFRTPFNLTSSGSINFINGARACDLFWNVGSDATINGTSFAGTILSSTGVHFGPGVTLDGRALAIGADVTMLGDTISGPSCAPLPANLTVTKVVINDNGGTKVVADFPLFVGVTAVVSGVANSFVAGAYAVTETSDATYTQTFSDDCDASGNINLVSGSNVVCTITNDDIAVVVPAPVVSSVNTSGSSHQPRVSTPTVTPPTQGQVLGVQTFVPGLPNAGFPPREQNFQSNIVLLFGFLALVGISTVIVSRKQTN